MREEIVHEVVVRLLTEPNFLALVKNKPRKTLRQYNLSVEELAAIVASDNGALGISRLESYIAAALFAPDTADPDS